MPLVLGLNEGDGFTIGYGVKVEKILSETQVRLRILSSGELIDVDDQQAKEIAPGVRVMVGTRGQLSLARLAIDADRSMKVSRDQPAKRDNRPVPTRVAHGSVKKERR